jgi:tetratricopeptide (TPR) repeat protein
MRRLWPVFFLLLQFSLGGCAYLSSQSSNLPDKIDSLLKQEQYGKALDILDYVKPTDKDYATLMSQKKHIQQLATRLESSTIKAGKKYISQKEWYQAQMVYEQALDKYPQSKKLHIAQQHFLQQRKIYLQQLELILLINKANWLIGNAAVQKKMQHALPNDYERYPALRNYDQEVIDTGDKLTDCLKQALDKNNYKLARTCLQLAEKIGSPDIDQQTLASARKTLARVKGTRISKRNTETLALIAELKQGYSHDNLRRARQQLDVLAKHPGADPESIQLQKELGTLFRKGIDQGIAGGSRQYSQGHIEEALQIWTDLNSIDPGNQKLAEHIDRAEHVMEKLDRLSKEGAKIKPPDTKE